MRMEERVLLKFLRQELIGEKGRLSDGEAESVDWLLLAKLAGRQGVLSLLYDSLAKPEYVPPGIQKIAADAAKKTALQNYRLLFLSKYLLNRLLRAGIPAVLLKGASAAYGYPTPELRKSGDADLLLLEPKKLGRACEVLESSGFRKEADTRMQHHVTFITEDGIETELHVMLAEPFDHAKINRYLQGHLAVCREQMIYRELMGVRLPVLSDGDQAYGLLIHMLQHYLRAGFGLKLLCDWTVFWNRKPPKEAAEHYLKLIQDSGLKGFSDTITEACCLYLGLQKEAVCWMDSGGKKGAARELMADILEGGEFGRSSAERMVSLRSRGVRAYVREFHHQMCLSYPKGSRYRVLWLMLWTATLIRFLHNNRRVRKTTALAVIRKAGQRSRLTAEMELWKY
ncbi:MAG: nucleotidyltransferase family protein [Lachnospiraceae bacterium]|nr:nucleotidyltransferase family protein [Lachnospiraceae bacterium]